MTDPVTRFIEKELDNQQKQNERFYDKVESYEESIYADSSGTLTDSFGELTQADDWWLEIVWNDIRKRSRNPNDKMLGRLLRQHVERYVRYLALIQTQEDLSHE